MGSGEKVYSICAPVIPVQECHKAMDVCNPAFEVEYFRDTLRIAGWWAERLGREKEELWEQVAEHMAELTEKTACTWHMKIVRRHLRSITEITPLCWELLV